MITRIKGGERLATMARDIAPGEVEGKTERMLTVSDVAELLGVSLGWVYRACANRMIPHIGIGARARWEDPNDDSLDEEDRDDDDAPERGELREDDAAEEGACEDDDLDGDADRNDSEPRQVVPGGPLFIRFSRADIEQWARTNKIPLRGRS